MPQLSKKQQEFHDAMREYHSHDYYQYIYKIVSFLNVILQGVLLVYAFSLDVSLFMVVVLFVVAYFLTDFLNGLVHMYMDNNDKYTSKWGAFIASFHLHHKIPKYKNNALWIVYFNESGMKFWLVVYLALVLLGATMQMNDEVLLLLIMIGVLSSVAEVSHYLCHNANSPFVLMLQKYRILLPMSQHRKHHENENEGYAFLNGSSDFLIDKIAQSLYKGYKSSTDVHSQYYKGEGTANRNSEVM